MQPEIGKAYEGVVRRITDYGMFVAVTAEDGTTWSGMVHISEISRQYTTNINDVYRVGDTCRVKVIAIDEQGRIRLSIKQLQPAPETERPARPRKNAPSERRPKPEASRATRPKTTPQNFHGAPPDFVVSSSDSFEAMLSKFKQNTDDKIMDARRENNPRRRPPHRKD